MKAHEILLGILLTLSILLSIFFSKTNEPVWNYTALLLLNVGLGLKLTYESRIRNEVVEENSYHRIVAFVFVATLMPWFSFVHIAFTWIILILAIITYCIGLWSIKIDQDDPDYQEDIQGVMNLTLIVLIFSIEQLVGRYLSVPCIYSPYPVTAIIFGGLVGFAMVWLFSGFTIFTEYNEEEY